MKSTQGLGWSRIRSLGYTLLASILISATDSNADFSWESYLHTKLVAEELTQFGIDADVRRLLDDPVFEADLRKWWDPVTPDYAQTLVRPQSVDPVVREGWLEGAKAQDLTEARQAAAALQLESHNSQIFSLRAAITRSLRSVIPSEKVQIYLAYFLNTQQKQKAKSLLKIYLVQFAQYARELIEDPRLQGMPQGAMGRLRSSALLLDALEVQAVGCGVGARSVNAAGACLIEGDFASVGAQVAQRRGLSAAIIQAEQAAYQSWASFAGCVDNYQSVADTGSFAQCLSRSLTVGPTSLALTAERGIAFSQWVNSSGPARAISRTGFIRGNDLQYFTENRHDPEILNYYQGLYRSQGSRRVGPQSGTNIGPITSGLNGSTGSVDEFERLLRANSSVYTGPDYPSANEHLGFQLVGSMRANNSMFPELLRAIRAAKHTIFLDMFFLGGNFGLAMARELVARADQGVKVYVLHDTQNAFEYAPEIEPVFNYLMAQSRIKPQNLIVASSFIFAHRTGLPAYSDAALPDSLVQNAWARARGLVEHLPANFPKAKSDHSKVLVIDGAARWTDSIPVAYIGSKNWTDSSGVMTFDEVLRVAGPAAVATQNDYYWDFWYALRAGGNGRAAMSDGVQIEALLADLDVLGRRFDPQAGRVVLTRTQLERVGAQRADLPVRLGHNSFDSSHLSVIDQNISVIRGAKKQVLISDQFLYDRRIVEELLERARDPQFQIYILLEPLSKDNNQTASDMGGFPNTLYLDQLMYSELELDQLGRVTRRVLRPNLHVRWKWIPEHPLFHLEYHMKTISADGFQASGERVSAQALPVLISGSANKDHMTLLGAFREIQAEVYDSRPCQGEGAQQICGAVAEHDRMFWRRWHNQASPVDGGGSVEIDPFRFTLYPQFRDLSTRLIGRVIEPAEFLPFARNLIHTLYDLENSSCIE